MPTIDGRRVVADLKRLAEFGRYKTGVHRPTYSPVDVEVAALAGRASFARRARHGDRRHRQRDRPQPAAAAPAAGRLAQRDPALWRLARRLARGDLRAGARPRLCRGSGLPGLGSRSPPGRTRKAITAIILGSRSFTDALPEDEIDRIRGRDDGTPLREALRTRRLCRAAARAGRSGALCRLSRSAYRAGRHARHVRIAHRRRRDDRRHLELPGLADRRAEPCRHDAHGAAQGCRGGDGAAGDAAFTTGFRRSPARARCGRSAACCSNRTRRRSIPGRAEMQVQFRDADPERLASVREDACTSSLAKPTGPGPCRVAIEPMARSEPRPMDPGFQAQIEAAAERHAPGMHMRMPSAAGPRRRGAVVSHAGRA